MALAVARARTSTTLLVVTKSQGPKAEVPQFRLGIREDLLLEPELQVMSGLPNQLRKLELELEVQTQEIMVS